MKVQTLLLTPVFLFFITTSVFAQLLNDRFAFDPDLPYDESITSPAEFLGYELGTEYSHHYQLGQYLHNLAEESDKVSIITY